MATNQTIVLEALQRVSKGKPKGVLLDDIKAEAKVLSVGDVTAALVMFGFQGKVKEMTGGRWLPSSSKSFTAQKKPRSKTKTAKPKVKRSGTIKQKICQPCRTVQRDAASGRFKPNQKTAKSRASR